MRQRSEAKTQRRGRKRRSKTSWQRGTTTWKAGRVCNGLPHIQKITTPYSRPDLKSTEWNIPGINMGKIYLAIHFGMHSKQHKKTNPGLSLLPTIAPLPFEGGFNHISLCLSWKLNLTGHSLYATGLVWKKEHDLITISFTMI